jgi:hypothetical protein
LLQCPELIGVNAFSVPDDELAVTTTIGPTSTASSPSHEGKSGKSSKGGNQGNSGKGGKGGGGGGGNLTHITAPRPTSAPSTMLPPITIRILADLDGTPTAIPSAKSSKGTSGKGVKGGGSSVKSAKSAKAGSSGPTRHQRSRGGDGGKTTKPKLTELILQYTGTNCNCGFKGEEGHCHAQMKKKINGADPDGRTASRIVASGFGRNLDVAVGDTIVLTGAFKSKLKFTIRFDNGDRSKVTIYTSGSKPLRYGDTFGSLTVVGFTTVGGTDAKCDAAPPAPTFVRTQVTTAAPTLAPPPPQTRCEICSKNNKNKPSSITFLYSAGQGVSANTQGSKAYGDMTATYPTTAAITMSGFSATVSNGDEFTISGSFDAYSIFTIDGRTIAIHTSCSVDLFTFDQYGPLTIVGSNSCTGPSPTCIPFGEPAVDRDCNVCSANAGSASSTRGKGQKGSGTKAKLTTLILEYTGANCNIIESNHCNSQDVAKTSVKGDPSVQAGSSTVTIDVEGGETFINVQIGTKVELSHVPHPAAMITITSETTGSVLSLVEFHSSCSVPLFHGDEFGSLRLVGFTTDDGTSATDKCLIPPACTSNTGTVFGHLYLDTNGLGTQQADEPNLANVDVVVTDSNGDIQTITSDANGDWVAIVPPGATTADIDESDPEYPTGSTQTEGTDPTTVTAVADAHTPAGIDGFHFITTTTTTTTTGTSFSLHIHLRRIFTVMLLVASRR